MLKIKIYPFLSKNAFELIVIIWLNETKKVSSHSERGSLRKNLYNDKKINIIFLKFF